MNVKCRRCGASVAPDVAFCPECGAVMAEALDETVAEHESEQFQSTILPSGEYKKGYEDFARPTKKETPPRPPAKPDAAAPAPRRAVAPQEKVRSRSSAYVILGLVAVVLLGALFIYLLSVILSR